MKLATLNYLSLSRKKNRNKQINPVVVVWQTRGYTTCPDAIPNQMWNSDQKWA